MSTSSRYDIIIIGTGPGGGTLAHKLAPSGKKILLLERGGYIPREKDNWSSRTVFIENRYKAKETWRDKNGGTFHPGIHYNVGGNSKVYGAALLRMRDEVEGLIQTQVDVQRVSQTGLFDRLAGNLGALGFLIDMLSVQPQLAKSLFVFDARTGRLDPLMGRGGTHKVPGAAPAPPPVEPRLIEQAQMLAFSAMRDDVPVTEVARALERLSNEAHAADQNALASTVEQAREALVKAEQADDREGVASVRGDLSEALVDFVNTASDAATLEPEVAAVRATPVAAAPAAVGTAELAEDDEMRDLVEFLRASTQGK